MDIYLHNQMKIENTQSQMRKGVLEYCILTLASAGEMYASDIITHLKDAKLIVVEGTLYPLLTRLKNAGLLKYEWKESDQGPPRKYYSLTEEGQAFTEQLADTWSELKSSVTKITESK
jgi:PadR family transcriptional regulator PadR